MEYRRGRMTQEYRRWGRSARLARFSASPGATHVMHDDNNLRAASASTSAAFASSERPMRWTKAVYGQAGRFAGDAAIGARNARCACGSSHVLLTEADVVRK